MVSSEAEAGATFVVFVVMFVIFIIKLAQELAQAFNLNPPLYNNIQLSSQRLRLKVFASPSRDHS